MVKAYGDFRDSIIDKIEQRKLIFSQYTIYMIIILLS